MQLITVHVTEFDLKKLDELVKKGMYPTRAEAIRLAVHDLINSELSIEEQIEKIHVDIKETAVSLTENGKTFQIEILREKDGSIWGIYPEKPQNEDCIFADGIRNILLLFRKGIFKLDDFPRKTKGKEAS